MNGLPNCQTFVWFDFWEGGLGEEFSQPLIVTGFGVEPGGSTPVPQTDSQGEVLWFLFFNSRIQL